MQVCQACRASRQHGRMHISLADQPLNFARHNPYIGCVPAT
ncbi:hypothetical protein PLANPX_3548 [Lacipirellula parvula]|uniref:Uncharacterized protein n=1 Tax=Lacipirellula parvula TaxID=2650471 RepID=A0A5K7XI21_9BACT|nr:hypothetical protein PLANPX_3548 [Lacipirellula parvula]